MSLFKERLKQSMQSKKVRQVDIVAETGIPKAAICNYLAGRYEPTGDRLRILADYFNVSPAWLAGYTDDPINYDDPDLIAEIPQAILEHFDGDARRAYIAWKSADADYIDEGLRSAGTVSKNDTGHNRAPVSGLSEIFPNDNIYKIPVFSTVSAGFGAYACNDIEDYIPVYISNPADVPDTIGIRVSGDSMYPKIEDGDIIIVRKQDSVDSGSIAVMLLDGDEGLVKKVEYGRNWIDLISINPEYKTRRFENEEVLRLRVVGLVIGSYKKF